MVGSPIPDRNWGEMNWLENRAIELDVRIRGEPETLYKSNEYLASYESRERQEFSVWYQSIHGSGDSSPVI